MLSAVIRAASAFSSAVNADCDGAEDVAAEDESALDGGEAEPQPPRIPRKYGKQIERRARMVCADVAAASWGVNVSPEPDTPSLGGAKLNNGRARVAKCHALVMVFLLRRPQL